MFRVKEQTPVRSRCGVASHGDLYGAALVKQTAGRQQVSHPPGVVPGGRVHVLLRETPGLGGSSLGELSRGSETVSSPWAPAGRSATVLHSGGRVIPRGDVGKLAFDMGMKGWVTGHMKGRASKGHSRKKSLKRGRKI